MINRAVKVQSFDAKDPYAGLALVTKPVPKAEAGHVVVQITLRPVLLVDLMHIRHGANGFFTPGAEGFGIVHDIGEGVKTVKKGQRVVPFLALDPRNVEGSWQQYICVKEELLWAVPDSISDEVAAQFVINPWTLYGMLTDLKVPKGEYVLQTAAGSGLGRQVIQLAKHWGIKTINVVRRVEQKEELKALGADEVICTNEEEDVATRVKEITGGKLAYGAIDPVAGTLTKQVVASVRDGGQVFVFGALGGYDITVGVGDLFRGVRLTGWNLYNAITSAERRKLFTNGVSKLMEAKIIVPLVGETYDLADFQLAIKKSTEVSGGGKVLLSS
ncbi:unnamed protein product [Sphagnum jensenii]|uniref:Enoyl reductase (ER) domain-containing protein n=1 Tax=Sphagnum jensenii TaxID=128206 RepID=A0ABP0XLN1_9BRYO